MVFRYKQCLDSLYTTYLATKKQISYKTFLEFTSVLKLRVDHSWLETSSQKMFSYLSGGNDHPVVQAAISYIYIATLERKKTSFGLLAGLMAYVFLYKYGYDLNGMLVLEEELSQKRENMDKLLGEQTEKNLLTNFLEYFTEIYILCCEKILRQITNSKSRMDISSRFFDLNSRQKEILLFLEKPGSAITNRDVQKMFHISQITASRDLTDLASLGALFPHGKGRSVSYTKV